MRTYEEELQWFKQYKEELEQRELERDDLRFREKDYLRYLQRWFSEEDVMELARKIVFAGSAFP